MQAWIFILSTLLAQPRGGDCPGLAKIVKQKIQEARGLDLLERTLTAAHKNNWGEKDFESIADDAVERPISQVLAGKVPPERTIPSQAPRKPRRIPPGPGKKPTHDGDYQDDRSRNLPTERSLEFRELQERVAAALKQLPGNQADIMQKIYFQGMTMKQVSEQLGIALGTIKSSVSRALARLRENPELKDYFGYLDTMREAP